MEYKKNQIVRLTVTDMNNKGYGVARLGGKVVFVQNAVTGEEVLGKIIKVASDYLVARVEERLVASPYRCEAGCSASGKCGGCVYQQITYDHELQLKKNYVENAFRKARVPVTVADCEGGKPSGYRNKVECPITPDYKPGFYAQRSHTAVAVEECGLENPIFFPIIQTVMAWLEREKISVYDETTGKGVLRHLYLRVGEATGEVMVCLVINGTAMKNAKAFAEAVMSAHRCVVSVVLNFNSDATNVILGKKCQVIGGREYIEDSLCGVTFRLSPLSFYQVNHSMAERLYAKALSLAALSEGDTLADLFCGVGTIGLYMMKNAKVKSLVGVEIVPEAIENAKANAERNGIENATFICGDANTEALNAADVIVVDPPRKGCGEALLRRIAEIDPKRLVYISCNPDTLARDVAILKELGYEPGVVYPFDLFPRTGHVESVVCLTKQTN